MSDVKLKGLFLEKLPNSRFQMAKAMIMIPANAPKDPSLPSLIEGLVPLEMNPPGPDVQCDKSKFEISKKSVETKKEADGESNYSKRNASNGSTNPNSKFDKNQQEKWIWKNGKTKCEICIKSGDTFRRPHETNEHFQPCATCVASGNRWRAESHPLKLHREPCTVCVGKKDYVNSRKHKTEDHKD